MTHDTRYSRENLPALDANSHNDQWREPDCFPHALAIDESAMSLSHGLIRLVRSKPVEQSDLEQTARYVLDAAANMIAGARSEPGSRFIGWAQQHNLLGSDGLAADAGRNAFVLGALAHCLELDDLHRRSVTHPGCVVAPIPWAIASSNRQPIEGRRALTAVLHGFEAMTRIGRCVGSKHYKIWHNTATCGPFGSALAAAYLFELDDESTTDALGNAGTQAAGLWEFLETGAMSKHLHSGRASEAGMTAASLACHGITGAPLILEGARGFFAAMCPDASADLLLSNPDEPWQIHATSLKPWPSCRHTHPAIDAGLEVHGLMAKKGVSYDAISKIDIGTYPAALDLCDRPNPSSAYAAKFSLQHCVAAALVFGEIWFDAFEAPAREQCAALRALIHLKRDDALEARYPQSWGGTLAITLSDGEKIQVDRTDAKGDPELPLASGEITAKAAKLLAWGGLRDPQPFIDAVLIMAEGSNLPALPLPLGASETA
jgi:2-methylcitrate dehydratase PrpD